MRTLQKNHWIGLTLGFCLVWGEAPNAYSGVPPELPSTREATATLQPRRSIRLSTSYLNAFMNPFPGMSTSLLGPAFTYEFIVAKNVHVGLYTAFRPALSNPGWSWFGYGFVLKDYLVDTLRDWIAGPQPTSRVRPYFEYGLLLASVRASGREQYAIAHDTRLGIGLDVTLDSLGKWVITTDLNYHLSWLRYFSAEVINLNAAEVNLGLRYVW